MHAPEEGHRAERLLAAEHVRCGRLPQSFGDTPVFDTDFLPRVRIRQARDIACREDAGDTRLEILIHGNAAIQGQTRTFSEFRPVDLRSIFDQPWETFLLP